MSNQHTAYIEFISRGQVRGGYQWSTIRTTTKLHSMGYVCTQPYRGTLVQRVTFEGTREEILHHRLVITNQLKVMSGGKVPTRFHLIT